METPAGHRCARLRADLGAIVTGSAKTRNRPQNRNFSLDNINSVYTKRDEKLVFMMIIIVN
jgi:hypothetical protein